MAENTIRIRSTYQDGASAGLRSLQTQAKGAGGSFLTSFGPAGKALGAVETGIGRVGNAMSHAKGQIMGVASSLGAVAGVGGVLGLGMGLSKAVTSAKDFQAAMELLHTQTGATQQEVVNMTGAVLDLSKAVGTSPEILAAGLYHVESAGLRGAKALDILKVAAEGAKVGGADLESVTNALIAANQSGVKGVQDMASAMGTLNAIVGSGNMRMQDLTDAMGTGVLSTAKNYGVSIQSVGAALASMTDQSIPAIDAATRLSSAMRLMAAPASAGEKVLKTIGLSGLKLATDMRGPGGILSAIIDLKDHLDKSGLSASQQAQVIAHAFGGRQSGAILTLIGNVDLLRQKQDAVNKGAAGFGEAWAKAQEEAQFKLDRFSAAVDATMIKVGNALLPMLTQAAGQLGDWISAHQTDIVNAVTGAAETAKNILGAAGDAVRAIAGFWNGLPPQLRDVLLKGFIADRTFKWLFGIDPAKAVLNFAVSGIETALGRAVGSGLVGAGLGKLFVQPVYVTNPGFGLGGGGGGGVATAAEDAAAMGGLRGLLNKIPVGVVAAVDIAAIAGVVATWMKVNSDVGVGSDFQKSVVAQRTKEASDNLSELQKLRADLEGQLHAGGGDPLASLLKNFTVNPAIQQQLDDLDKKIAALGGSTPGYQRPPGMYGPGATVGGSAAQPSDYGSRHPTGVAVGPGADFALRHPEAQKPLVKIDAADFLKILKGTAFIGPEAYKSIWEKIGGKHGEDPFGQRFLSLLQNVTPAQLKTPAVLTEIRGHEKELLSLERYYLAHGDVKAAKAVDDVYHQVVKLTGTTAGQTPYMQQQTHAAQATKDAVTRQNPELAAVKANTAALLHKNWTLSVNLALNVSSAGSQGYRATGSINYSGKKFPIFGEGGRPKPGEAAIVGERGPELFVPDRPGTVVPHALTQSLLHGRPGAGTRLPGLSAAGVSIGAIYVDARGADNASGVMAAARRGVQQAADHIALSMRDQTYRSVASRLGL